jgi:hypothetical protein
MGGWYGRGLLLISLLCPTRYSRGYTDQFNFDTMHKANWVEIDFPNKTLIPLSKNIKKMSFHDRESHRYSE